MNELIRINYEAENPTVSARELYEELDACENFMDFFIKSSEMKLRFGRENLKMLITVLRKFYSKYGAESIIYLSDSIYAEMALPCNSIEAEKFSESMMKKEILNNFDKIFPQYDCVKTEKCIKGIGRIDIYAEENGRPVIIELKISNKSPNQQLLAYGANFENPMLIGITELPLEKERKIPGVKYFSLGELRKKIDNWII